jgi:uncharacterized protein (TIGR03435 family)
MKRRRVKVVVIACAALVANVVIARGVPQDPSALGSAVDPKLKFEVASVKRNELGPQAELWGYRNGRMTIQAATLRRVILAAFYNAERPITEHQLAAAPRWLDIDRFDIVATAPGIPETSRGTFPPEVLIMLRNLLEERFQLKTHMETKEFPLLALILARRDGSLGPGLRRRTAPCTASADRSELFSTTTTQRQTCGGRVGPGILISTGARMSDLVSAFSQLIPGIEQIVVDRTGLTGTFDVDLKWTPESALTRGGDTAPTPSEPPLFTAIQDQLGLRFERTKGPVDVLVIDRVEPPTAN